MKLLQESRDVATVPAAVEDASHTGWGDGEAGRPCDILLRLAQAIHLMRLDPTDAHLYLDGCDALVERAIAASKWSQLPRALTQVMRLVTQRDYHWALIELRTITQPEWHSC